MNGFKKGNIPGMTILLEVLIFRPMNEWPLCFCFAAAIAEMVYLRGQMTLDLDVSLPFVFAKNNCSIFVYLVCSESQIIF